LLDKVLKSTETSNFMKIRLVVDDLFHVDLRVGGQTGRYDEANDHVLSFCSIA